MNRSPITVKTEIEAGLAQVWNCWNQPEHIMKWNAASDDWHCPRAENDLRPGGKLSCTMASRDGKMSFDFEAVYDDVKEMESISYTMSDGRTVHISFEEKDGKTYVTETFDPESSNPEEMQKNGWQAILDNFKKHVQSEN